MANDSDDVVGSRSDTGAVGQRRDDGDVGYIDRDDLTRGRRDQIRWGPVWAGLVVALATYMLLQLALIATGAVELSDADTGDALLSAAAALVAFFLGGVTAGATAMWRGADDGLLHGVVLWALGFVAVILLAGAGGGAALGALDASKAFDNITAADSNKANDDAQDVAAKALLGVSAALAAAAVGGLVGAKAWPHEHDRPSTTRTTTRA